MVAATMKISEFLVVVYNFLTRIANWSILVKKSCFIAELISWPWEGAIQNKEFIIYNFITLDSILTATTITEYCKIAYASNMFICTKFMIPYQNCVLPLSLYLYGEKSVLKVNNKYRGCDNLMEFLWSYCHKVCYSDTCSCNFRDAPVWVFQYNHDLHFLFIN